MMMMIQVCNFHFVCFHLFAVSFYSGPAEASQWDIEPNGFIMATSQLELAVRGGG